MSVRRAHVSHVMKHRALRCYASFFISLLQYNTRGSEITVKNRLPPQVGARGALLHKQRTRCRRKRVARSAWRAPAVSCVHASTPSILLSCLVGDMPWPGMPPFIVWTPTCGIEMVVDAYGSPRDDITEAAVQLLSACRCVCRVNGKVEFTPHFVQGPILV